MTIEASQPRRWLAVICLAGLGVLLLSLVFEPSGGLWRLGFLIAGILAFLAANNLRLATEDRIELTRAGLRTGKGVHLVALDNVKSVERGIFAFKPSNGFLVRMHKPEGRGWAPGLWWKRGRSLGIGGVVSGGQARAMAELLTALHMGYDIDP